MKLSISNIAWISDNDDLMYRCVSDLGFKGLEIAPTRIFPQNPYDNLIEAMVYSKKLKEIYNLDISSMQSIWFGKTERIFGTEEERLELINYTKKAIDFATKVNCKNLVLGSPKNRIIDNDKNYNMAVDFFRELGRYAAKRGTVLSIEPNPKLYGTNYINYTKEAFDLVCEVKSDGFKVNVDFGTIIENEENLSIIENNIEQVNHIHISEPNLNPIIKRENHKELADILKRKDYNKFVSIEMKKNDNLEDIKSIILYVKEVF